MKWENFWFIGKGKESSTNVIWEFLSTLVVWAQYGLKVGQFSNFTKKCPMSSNLSVCIFTNGFHVGIVCTFNSMRM